MKPPGPCLNVKIIFPGYKDSHYKDETVVRPSYLYKAASSYWDDPPDLSFQDFEQNYGII